MSARPICIAMLQNQAKNITCQMVNRLCPSNGTPVQIVSLATVQKVSSEVTPSCGRTATPQATKTSSSQGAATFEKRAICSNPRIASTVTTAPTSSTVTTQPTLFG